VNGYCREKRENGVLEVGNRRKSLQPAERESSTFWGAGRERK
jgi:hypothetical protein